MKSAITVCLVPEARLGPFVFHDPLNLACERAKRHGFDAIEVFPTDGRSPELAPLKMLLRNHELSLAAMGTGAGWLCHQWSLTSPDKEVRGRAAEFIERVIDTAGELGAPAILGSMQGRATHEVPHAEALAFLRDSLHQFAERAARHDQMFLYEPLNRYETNLFNRQEDAFRFLESNDASRGLPSNVRLLSDLFHMNIEEASLAESLRSVAKRLGHVHFADSNRRAMGLGHTQMHDLVTVLREIEYQGYLSAEVFPLPDAETAAIETMKSYREVLNMLEAEHD